MILRIRIAIPTYNNPTSITEVTLRTLTETPFPVLVVDDGSSDEIEGILRAAGDEIRSAFESGRLKVSRFPRNRGKGAAIQYAITDSVSEGFTHLVTLDGDGQHHPVEALRLAEIAKAHPWDLVIGARKFESDTVPGISKFGRKFSNHWVGYQTGAVVSDSQSGFRLYPLFRVQNLRFFTRKYDFEIEVLIRLIWAGTTVREVEIDVFYPKPDERVSHFHKFRDNLRISVLNTVLVIVSLLKTHRSPRSLAFAVGTGVLIGTSPFFGMHFLIAGAISFFFRLNAAAVLLGTQISIPPLAPLLVLGSILTGHRILTAFGVAAPLDDLSGGNAKVVLGIALHHFGQWFLGSLILGSLLGLLFGILTYLAARRLQPAKATWTGTTRGGKFGNTFLIFILRRLGLRVAYGCVVFIIPYFYLFAPKARHAAQEYWRVTHPEIGRFRRQFQVMAPLFRFAQVLLDRVYQSYHPEPVFRMRSQGGEKMIGVREKTGLICVAAHAGAWDLAASLLKNRGFRGRFYMVHYHANGLRFDDFKRPDDPHVESVKSNDDQPIFQIKQALGEGGTVALMGDRPLGNQFELVPFFGKLAPFDVTPFRLSAACDVPVLFTFGFKSLTESGLYEFYATREERHRYAPTDRALQCYDWVGAYVGDLEAMLKRYPEQWFNFFPFWSTVPAGEKESRLKNHLVEELRKRAPSEAELGSGSTRIAEK
jgi:predicted LPLAT superfamily acyltransferase/glycosyltransferase involved in cell wall biosynthesis